MEKSNLDMYVLSNQKYFTPAQLMQVRQTLENVTDQQAMALQSIDYKDPTMILIISLIVGYLGIDRILVGDVGLGIVKMLTCGGLGIWTLVDWFVIMDKAREYNFQKFMMATSML